MENKKKYPAKEQQKMKTRQANLAKERNTLSLTPSAVARKNVKFAVIIKDGKKNKIAGIGNELKKVDSMSRKIN